MIPLKMLMIRMLFRNKTTSSLILTLPAPIPDEEKKLT